MILLHVAIAIFSLIFTTYTYLQPSAKKLRVSYGLAAGTVATGVYLVWSAPTHMLEACMMGLFYLGLVTLGIIAARTKLAAISVKNHS